MASRVDAFELQTLVEEAEASEREGQHLHSVERLALDLRDALLALASAREQVAALHKSSPVPSDG